jgi:hypothetical protein
MGKAIVSHIRGYANDGMPLSIPGFEYGLSERIPRGK